MPKYMLILHDNMAELAKFSPDELQKVVARYGAWSAKMGKAGKLVGGEKLTDEGGKHLTAKGGKMSVKDGPYVEAKEVVGGYFLIEAKDYAEAAKLCEDCPHLSLNGRIELRQIDVM
jgi:hypothetical protein